MSSRIALTGATGFLGSHIADLLVERGSSFVATARNPAKAARLREQGVEVREADLANTEALVEAFAGCDTVIANAAVALGQGPIDPAVFAINLAGTENTLRAAAKAGARRVVYVSTVAVYRTRPFRLTTEDAPQLDIDNPGFDLSMLTTNVHYSRSKARAERLAWSLAAELGLAITVLRPGPIYGPRDDKMTQMYAGWMARPVHFAPTLAIPHAHGGDVAAAIVGAVDRPDTAGKAYNTTGPPVGVYAFLSAWRRLAGRGARLVPIPLPVSVAFDNTAAERDLGATWRSVDDGVQSVLVSLQEA